MAKSIKLANDTFWASEGVVVDGAGTTLKSYITTKSGTITMQNGSLLAESYARQSGKIVDIYLCINGIPAASATTDSIDLCTISGISLPISSSRSVRTVGATGTEAYYAYNSAYVIINNAGVVTLRRSKPSDTALNVHITYIVA